MKWLFAATLSALVYTGIPAKADTTSCDYPESLLTDALKDEPARLVKKLDGQDLATFLNKMASAGYFSGTLDNIDSLYIIKGKLLPGHDVPLDILFFVQNGCIVGKVIGTASVVEGLL